MTKADDRHGRKQPELTVVDSAFQPRPVAPEEGRRRDPGASTPAQRAIVELTSPLGHKLRVPEATDSEAPGAAGEPAKPKS